MLNYAAIMKAGQSLVPDMRQQMMQDEEMQMRRQESEQRQQFITAQQQALRAKALEAQRGMERQAGFADEMEAAIESGDPRAMNRVRMRYPEFSKDMKDAFDSLEEDQRRTNMTQLGVVRARLAAGDVDGAREAVMRRYEADKAAGLNTEDDEELLELINSGDPERLKLATGVITYTMASLDPDSFAETYGRLDPQEKLSPVMREYNDRVAQFGKKAADLWLATQDTSLVTVEPGGSVYNKADFVTQPGGGDPSGSPGLVPTREQEAESARVAERLGLPFEGASFDQPAQQYGAARDGGSRRHNGLDFSGPLGTPVRPVLAGTVVGVGSDGTSGNFAKVRHADGSVSSYSHLGKVTVSEGQQIGPGTSLGTLGRTGNARAGEGRGVLHFVMRDAQGRPVNPAPLFGQPGGGSMPRIASKQQYDRLPSGAQYIAPDGSPRRKP